MAWDAWGDPALAKPLSDGIRSLLEQALGVAKTEIPAPTIDEVDVTPSALTDQHRAGRRCAEHDDPRRCARTAEPRRSR